MKYLTLLFAILLSAYSASAQEMEPEWVAKPVQCGSIEDMAKITKEKGLSLTFAGDGLSNSVNYDEPLPVFVFLGINPETNEWALTEIDTDQNRGCVLGYGDSFTIDANTMQKLAGPRS